MEFTENIIIPKDTTSTLDLGEYTLSNSKILAVYGDLTITGDGGRMESDIQLGTYGSDGTLSKGAELTLDGDVTLYFENYGISIFGEDSVVNIKDGTIDAGYFALSGNGMSSRTLNSEINISGGEVTVRDDVAIYHPQHGGTITITGGTVEGVWAAVQMCSGSLTVSGDDTLLRATSDTEFPNKDDLAADGSVEDGAALSLLSRKGYGGEIGVDISGGTFEATHYPVKYYGVKTAAASGSQVTLDYSIGSMVDSFTVTGGTFIGGEDDGAIWDGYLETSRTQEGIDGKNFLSARGEGISGGVFSHDVTDFVADGCRCAVNSDGLYEVFAAKDADFALLADGEEIDGTLAMDLADRAQAKLSVSEILYGPYTWSIDDERVASLEAGEDGTTAVLTARSAGTATVTVASEMDPSQAVTVTLNVSVADSRSFALTKDGVIFGADQSLILDANQENTEGNTARISVSDAAYGPYTWSVAPEGVVTPGQAEGDSVTLTAEAAGTATLTVTAAGLPAEKAAVTLSITVTDSTLEADSEGDVSDVSVSVDADSVDVPEVSGAMSAEQETQLEAEKEVLVAGLGADLTQNSSVSGYAVETDGDVVSEMAQAGLLEGGQKAVISTEQELKDVQLDTVVEYETDETGAAVADENGNPVVKSVTPVIRSLTWSVDPVYELQDLDGNRLQEKRVFDLNKRFSITFRIPVPSSVTERYANVEHISAVFGTERFQTAIRGAEGGRYIEITTDHFSDFVLTFTNTEEEVQPQRSGRSGGGNSSGWHPQGSWIAQGDQWKFKTYEGPFAVNCWQYLGWNGQNEWYHFDVNGFMQTGWFTDADGRIYYLYPVADGTRGRMLTGWQNIDGKMYYFNTVSDGTRGALYVNCMTPDGYLVGADGAMIQ